MTEIILKNDLEKSKLDALIQFLKSWNIEVEIKKTKSTISKNTSVFSLSNGIWKDFNINSNELRKQA